MRMLSTMRLLPSAQFLVIGFLPLNLNRYVNTRYGNMQYEKLHDRNIREFSKHIIDKKKDLEFRIPEIEIKRNDDMEIREKIMSIDPEERKKLKINKSTLWYQQKNIKEGKAIKVYRKTKVRIE